MLVSCRDINCVTKEDHQEDHISRCYKMPYMPTISAEANIPFHLAESLLSITTTIGPSRQCRGQYSISFGRIITINHHHHWAEPSAPRPTYHFIWLSHYYQSPLLLGRAVSAEANTMGRAIYTDITPAPIPLGPSISIGYSSTTGPPVRNTYNIQWAHHRMARLTWNIVNLGCPLQMD